MKKLFNNPELPISAAEVLPNVSPEKEKIVSKRTVRQIFKLMGKAVRRCEDRIPSLLIVKLLDMTHGAGLRGYEAHALREQNIVAVKADLLVIRGNNPAACLVKVPVKQATEKIHGVK
jgi:hypothetical protein